MLIVDEAKGLVTVRTGDTEQVYPMDTPKAFEAVSGAWLRAGWDVKYVYGFTWMGRPIIQLPDDLVRLQEVVYRLRPSVVIETGVAHGGSLVFHASLFEAMGHGRVIGVDVEIRPHNRSAIESHPLFHRIELLEGDSIDPRTFDRVRALLREGDTVMVMLDSNHTRDHVLRELELYGELVSPGHYIIACDGIRERVVGGPRTTPDWSWNHPGQAAIEFTRADPRFRIEEPVWPFNEGVVKQRVTYWPSAFIRRLAG